MPHSVCLITGEYPPAVGGVADYTALLAGDLHEQGHTVVVVAGVPVESTHTGGVDARVPVRHVDGWGLLSILHLARFLRAAEVELVHLQYQAAPFSRSPFLHLLPALLRGAGVTARFVTTFHDLRPPYLFPKAGPLRPRAVDFLAHRSDGVIFTDPADLLATRRGLGMRSPASFGPTAWIPIGANVEPAAPPDRAEARARWGFAPDDVILAYFGFLNASKGAERLLQALAQLVARGLPARALFIGHEHGASDATNRETATRARQRAASLGLAERVTWTGWLPAEDVSRALGTADVAVLPYTDGASLRRGSLLACFAHGVPVVTTRPPSTPDLPPSVLVAPFTSPGDFKIDDRVAQLVDADESGVSLAEAIGRVLEDRPRADALSAAGRDLVARLSWSAIGAATTAFYERVLSAPTRRGRP